MEKINENKENLGWIKSLLNNLTLLKWVKKYTADNLHPNDSMAMKYDLKTTNETICVPDKTNTKLLCSHSRFNGKEYTRFNFKQICEVMSVVGEVGECIIRESKDKEMIIQVNDTAIVLLPLPKADKKKEEKKDE
jgi:hypothetical protein|tara:strand:- start:41292 stop:41696 length:405 start_codon:yes stop_codon:yes gene_type:complete